MNTESNLRSRLASAVLDGKSILVAGSTGSGRTTMLDHLFEGCPTYQSILVIEQTPELSISGPLVRGLRATDEFWIGALLKASLKGRPDRIVIGAILQDCAEAAIDAVEAGIPTAATIHAESASAAWQRLVEMTGMSLERVQKAFPVVVVMGREPDGKRYPKDLVGA